MKVPEAGEKEQNLDSDSGGLNKERLMNPDEVADKFKNRRTENGNERRNDKPASKKKERLKRIRRTYQAELMKHLAFFQSARSFVELGSKPLSVQMGKSGEDLDTARAETVGPMEQLD